MPAATDRIKMHGCSPMHLVFRWRLGSRYTPNATQVGHGSRDTEMSVLVLICLQSVRVFAESRMSARMAILAAGLNPERRPGRYRSFCPRGLG